MSNNVRAGFLYGAHARANGIRQHYLRFGGSGEPLIIVPGITSPAATWAFVAERLCDTNDVYVLDVRGRGLSASGPDLAYDLDTCATDVQALAQALGFPRYTVLGHSLGARIAARLGARKDVPLSRLILADPPVSGPGRKPYGKSLAFYLDAIEQACQGTMTMESVRNAYPGWTEAQLRARAQWLHTCDVAAITANHAGFQSEEIQSCLPSITAPTLLIVAGKGGVITAQDIAEIHQLNPAIAIQTIAHAGHMLPFDDLEAFLSGVKSFLAR